MQQSAPEGTYGPHTTRAANTLDPRVDSDMDNRGAPPPPTTHQPPVTAGLNSTATTTTGTTENTGERIARGIKGKVAQGHVRPPPPIVGSVCVLMGCVCAGHRGIPPRQHHVRCGQSGGRQGEAAAA